MLSKENREKLLKRLTKSAEGNALKEFLEEKIQKLSDISGAKDWEDVLSRQKAINHLKDTLFYLGLLKQEEKEKDKNEYI